jgi:hypothetical protein
MHRLSNKTVAGVVTACFGLLPLVSHAADEIADRPATLQPPSRSAEDTFMLQDGARLGLRPPAASLRERTELPFGLNYSREARSLLMQLDEKNEWGLGLNLNLNATPAVELAPSGLHMAPRNTPGLMLQKKF